MLPARGAAIRLKLVAENQHSCGKAALVSSSGRRPPLIDRLYHQYLEDEDTAAFVYDVSRRYEVSTLERLAIGGQRVTRRAAVLAIGYLGQYDANATLGRALHDDDRGVR